jgi:drug/metabolite transporter (DMT)-like permease
VEVLAMSENAAKLSCEMPKIDKSVVFYSIFMLCSGVLNNVALAMMSYSFPGYPSFLNYFLTLLSCVVFLILALIRKEDVFGCRSLSWLAQKQYLILTACTVLSWVALEYTSAWVDGDLQQILSNLGFVFVYMFSVPILKLRISRWEFLSSVVIVAGVVVGLIPSMRSLADHDSTSNGTHPSWYNAWYFVFVFVLSYVFQALISVFQERALRAPYHLQEVTCLFWMTLYGSVLLAMFIPMESLPEINALPYSRSFGWAWANQAGAFKCLAGQPSDDAYPAQCASKNAWLWVILALIGFVSFYVFSNILFKKTSAFWTVLLQSLSSPIAAFVFNFPQIVGSSNYVAFNAYIAGSFGIILAGVLLRGTPDTPETLGVQTRGDDSCPGRIDSLQSIVNISESSPLLPPPYKSINNSC